MGFFDDLGKKVTDAGQKTMQKAQEMSEVARINSCLLYTSPSPRDTR